MINLIREHIQAIKNSLGQLNQSFGATLLTIGVIGIALALPLGLSVFLSNIQTVTGSLKNTSQISLYLNNTVSTEQAEQLLKKVRLNIHVNQATYVSPKEGLTEFSKTADFGDVLKDLSFNPLPGVIIVTPSLSLKPLQIQPLINELKKLPGVHNAVLDMQWLERLQALLSIGHRAALLLMILFAFAVLLIIGNTIRLTTQNHHQEILVIKIIGGTNAFIRRPFLYSGIIYGLVGAIFAWFLVDFAIGCFKTPLSNLASLYGTQYHITGLSLSATLWLIIGAMILGAAASWVAVNRYIAKVEPK